MGVVIIGLVGLVLNSDFSYEIKLFWVGIGVGVCGVGVVLV